MKTYILDTDFIVNFLRGEKKNIEIMRHIIEDENSKLFTTTINIYELTKGCFKSKNFDKNFSLIKELKKNITILNFDEDSALIAAEIFEDLEKKGTKINESDILIAGICLKNNFILLTENIKHFNKIEGLEIYNI